MIALALHQFRYDQKVFWRNPASVFFTVMLPLIFLFIFATIFGNDEIEERGVKTTTYYVPGDRRPRGDLGHDPEPRDQPHRGPRARPAEAGARNAAAGPGVRRRAGSATRCVVSLLMVVLVAVIGKLVYDVSIPTTTIPAVLVTLAVGAFSFCCLGFALTRDHPERGRGARRSRTRWSCRSTSSRASSSPTARSRAGCSRSPTCSRSAPSSRPSSPPGTRTRSGPDSSSGHLAVVAAWGVGGLADRGSFLSLGAATGESRAARTP